MAGNMKGLKDVKQVNTAAVFTHYMVYQEALASKSKSISLKNILDHAVKVMNSIKSKA